MIRLALMPSIRFPLSLRNFEELSQGCCIEIGQKTVWPCTGSGQRSQMRSGKSLWMRFLLFDCGAGTRMGAM